MWFCGHFVRCTLFSPPLFGGFFCLYGPNIRNFVDMSILLCLGNNYKLHRPLRKMYWTTKLFQVPHIYLLVTPSPVYNFLFLLLFSSLIVFIFLKTLWSLGQSLNKRENYLIASERGEIPSIVKRNLGITHG